MKRGVLAFLALLCVNQLRAEELHCGNTGVIYDFTGTPVTAGSGWLVQILHAGPNAVIDTYGSGDDIVVANATFNLGTGTDGKFFVRIPSVESVGIGTGTNIYARVFDSSTTNAATKYVDSGIVMFSTVFPGAPFDADFGSTDPGGADWQAIGVQMTVASAFGAPMPGTGTQSIGYGTLVNASVSSPIPDGASTQYVCTGWAGSGSVPVSGTSNAISFNITNASILTWNWNTQVVLNASAGANGSVTVSNGWYNYGASGVIVTAVPTNGYNFAGWTGDVAGTNNPLNLTMSQAYAVTANFAINNYDITASNVVNGTINPTGVTMVAHGSSQPYTINADSNCHIVNVWADGTPIGPSNNYTFVNVTNGGHVITAVFAIDTYTLSVTTPYGSANPAGVSTQNWNTPVNASIGGSPQTVGTTQYVATGWTGTGSVTPGSGTNTSFNLTLNSTLDWQWDTNYWLSTTSAPNGYVDVSSMWVNSGSNVMVQAFASNGYSFAGWTGDIVTNDNPLNVVMTGPVSVQANYMLNTYDIMAIGPANGSISPTGTTWVGHGSNQVYSIIPGTNYHIASVLIDGTNNIGATNSYTFANVTNGGHMISASFAIDQYTLNVASAFGTPTPAVGIQTNNWNDPINASVNTPIPNGASTQYVCTGWAGSGSVPALGTSNEVSFTVTNVSMLTWNWKTQVWLNASAGANGSVMATNGWYDFGTPGVIVTAVPTNGYSFTGWTGDVVGTTNPLNLTMSQAYSINADFSINSYDITASNVLNGTIMPTGTMMVAYGSSQPYTITPDANCHIVNVWLDGSPIGPSNNYTFVNVTNGGHVITAAFAIDTYTLSVTTPYGSANPAGVSTQNWNTPVNASIGGSPQTVGTTQYVATGWTGTGSVTPGSGTNTSFNLTLNSTLDWQWNTNYSLSVAAGANGAVTASNGWYAAGSAPVVSATPNGGYMFVAWSGDTAGLVTNANPLTVTMSQGRSLTANFGPALGYVTVTIQPAQAVSAGAMWRLTSGPDTAWKVSDAVVSNIPGPGPYTITCQALGGWTAPANITGIVPTNGVTSAFLRTYRIGDMVMIPGGTYTMGIFSGSGGHTVTVSTFYIDRKEVTVGEYQAFLADTAGSMPSAPTWGWGNTNLPIVNVTWNEASAYASWAGKRLPTEAEYEYAMRGGAADNLYPWGNSIAAGNANYNNNVATPTVAGSYTANGYGAFDMAGNVWEWCSDWYQDVLTGPVTDPTGPGSGTYKMMKGGSYANSSWNLQCAPRFFTTPGVRYVDVGFRCVSSVGAGGGGLLPGGDVDGDGVPDWWPELHFSLSGVTYEPDLDSDGDGLKNAIEYLTGTDPLNGASVLAVQSVLPPDKEQTGFAVTWISVPGKTYMIERASNLVDGFYTVSGGITASGYVTTFADTTITGTGPYFYRVKLQQ